MPILVARISLAKFISGWLCVRGVPLILWYYPVFLKLCSPAEKQGHAFCVWSWNWLIEQSEWYVLYATYSMTCHNHHFKMSQCPLWLVDCRFMIVACGFRLFWSLREKLWQDCWFNLSVSNRREKMNSWRGWSVRILHLPLESELEIIFVFFIVVYLTPFRNFQISPSFSKLLLNNHISSHKPY